MLLLAAGRQASWCRPWCRHPLNAAKGSELHRGLRGPTITVPQAVGGAFDVLQQTQPVDRLRYQARLLFDELDEDKDGVLNNSELAAYRARCLERLGAAAADEIDAAGTVDGGIPFDKFATLVRTQVSSIKSQGNTFVAEKLGRDAGRLLYQSCLTPPETAAILAVFLLLDADGDGKLRLTDLRKAQGIEKKIVEDLLLDADEDEDGMLSFEDWLMASYKKERPVFLSIAVMLAHTMTFWLILNQPWLDLPIKVVLCAIICLQPNLVTNPVVKVFNIIKALIDRQRATQELAFR